MVDAHIVGFSTRVCLEVRSCVLCKQLMKWRRTTATLAMKYEGKSKMD